MQSNTFLRERRRIAGLVFLLLGLPVFGISAQTRFQWTSGRLDVSQYTTIDECLAAGRRVLDSARTVAPVWIDTLLFSEAMSKIPIPADVRTTTRQCLERFDVENVPVVGAHLWLQLYLFAEKHSDGRRIIQRRLDAIDSNDLVQQIAVIDTFIGVYLRAQPVQGDAAEAVLEWLWTIEHRNPIAAVRVLRSATSFFLSAFEIGDSSHAKRAALHVKRLEAGLSDTERREGGYFALDVMRSFFAILYLRKSELMDSLRVSTSGYVFLRQKILGELTGGGQYPLPDRVGKTAVPITGNFWFRSLHADQPPPRRGNVSLLIFFRQDRCHVYLSSCYGNYAALRRIGKKFPNVEVTLIGHTLGYFSEAPPLDPTSEAEQLRALWLDYHQLLGTLAVTTTPFFHLPSPDGRRINQTPPNIANYLFGAEESASTGEAVHALIVDPDGVIVFDSDLYRIMELEASGILDILTRRLPPGGGSGTPGIHSVERLRPGKISPFPDISIKPIVRIVS